MRELGLLTASILAFLLGMVYADLTRQSEWTYCRARLEDGRGLHSNDLTERGENNCRYEAPRPNIGKWRKG